MSYLDLYDEMCASVEKLKVALNVLGHSSNIEVSVNLSGGVSRDAIIGFCLSSFEEQIDFLGCRLRDMEYNIISERGLSISK